MKVKAAKEEQVRAYIRLLGNPYASLSIYGETGEVVQAANPRARIKEMGNPYAFLQLAENEEDDNLAASHAVQAPLDFPTQPESSEPFTEPQLSVNDLGAALDEVLRVYKPYVARGEWSKVEEVRPVLMSRAKKHPEKMALVIKRLKKFAFTLLPGEKVEYNRASADKIISELEKVLVDLH